MQAQPGRETASPASQRLVPANQEIGVPGETLPPKKPPHRRTNPAGDRVIISP
jgi:hypothetical protein